MGIEIIKRLSIADDFFPFPGGRFRKNGKGSGEEFRDELLAPYLHEAISKNGVLLVNIDGVMGYPSSFLEEAFGGLVRERGFRKNELDMHLIIEATEPHLAIYKDLSLDYIADADRRRRGNVAVA